MTKNTFNLEQAISAWLRKFRKHRAFDEGELREIELHIKDHIDDLLAEGFTPKVAFEKAIQAFGEIQPIASEEYVNQKRSSLLNLFKATMYKSYMKTSFRRLLKHPLSTVINILGLAIAVGICVLVYSFGYWVNAVDQHHENKENVFLTTAFINRNGETQQWGLSPRPLGEMLANDFPQLQRVCRIQEQNVVIKEDDQVFHERISFVDPSYLEILTFPLELGSKSTLKDKSSIILSHKMAMKYFGDGNPLGADMKVIFINGEKKIFTVTGVAKKFPGASAIKFDFLIHYDNVRTALDNYDPEDWSGVIRATLVYLENPKLISDITTKMGKYKELQNQAMEDWQVERFKFEPLSTLYQNSSDINKTLSNRYYETNKMSYAILSILAIFMLALASVNYINIAIATASKRLKEIALRKTIGANRLMVVSQHLTENLITTFLALILGTLLGKYVFVPWFEYQNGYSSGFHFLDLQLWLYLVGVLIFTALISGLYPALYISKFQAVSIFRGKIKFGQGSFITKVFLGLQLVLATILIVCAIMFTQNTRYLQTRSWGYDPQDILYAQVGNYAMYDKLRDRISQYANVKDITGGSDHMGIHYSTKVMHQQERQYEINIVAVEPNYLSLVGLEVVAGRDFIHNSTVDRNSLIVNQKFLEQMSLDQAIGQEYIIDSTHYTIVGVVRDFHFFSFLSDIEPIVFAVGAEEDFRTVAFSVTKGTEMESYNFLKAQWSDLFPETPFRGGLQADVWGSYVTDLEWHGEFWRIIAYITVFMAALGLFGMISLNISGRIREFSIKKVLGANVRHIGLNVAENYVWLFLIAILIGSPLSYYLVQFLFDMVYPYHIPSNINSLLLSACILLSSLWCVVSILLVRINQANPIQGLKEE
ncbi:MAG: ABC transporter permease [Bacteroidota bacterium]